MCASQSAARSPLSVDPDSLGRSNFESYVYGTCAAEPGQSCAPPVEIQVWPACERSPADYNAGPPGAAEPIQASERLELRGVPARLYDDERLELNTAAVTVVIFANTKTQLLAAAEALRTPPGGATELGPQDQLASPVPDAQNGTLRC